MTEAEKPHKDSEEDDSTKGDMDCLFKKFRVEIISTTARSTTITSTTKTIVQGIPTETASIQNEMSESRSLVSVITADTITETLSCIITPATRITDVDVTVCCKEMERYTSISGMPISKTIGTPNMLTHVLVKVGPEILTCLLDPDTMRYVKIASNKIQEIEIKVWNMATNVDLYKPDGDKSLYVSPLQYRPKLSDSSALKRFNQIGECAKEAT